MISVLPSKRPIVINITSPVNNSDPQITTKIKPTGNTAPNINLEIPIGTPAATTPVFATSASKPPNAIYAPARKPKIARFKIGISPFAVAAEATAFAVSAGLLKLIYLNLFLVYYPI